MGLISAALPALARVAEPPVDPDAPEAREWILRELAKSEYQAAKPTLFDQIADRFWKWIQSLQVPVADGAPPLGLLLLLGVVVVVVVIALLVWGVPRANRRSRRGADGELFGAKDERDAAALRRAADQAARAGDWPLAIAERFRAIARALTERTAVTLTPGTTAADAARRAGAVFPAQADGLARGAAAFDDVRYLGGGGSREAYDELVALDRELAGARPRLDAAEPVSTVPR
ncbi:DUF4129 domain-containing protein [Schumannella sp. 10F1B-5-1]|uniref:DUF4129 domain-containing protein n=1 Tax=Schumannella sp. 10F1B-5-1 TaxID=2590780 RepID=UPI00113252AA|nr:DUF4129 domain-containing protein [Schumannella sp. 10F1B-5-1]TPW73584.1 DUF4129 domain-containing protein [Schumannella sp. 10F1B-5-1]